MPIVRLVTVHPALVHFTIGAVPVLVLAYVMAVARRSPQWTFVGDVTAAITAAITLATAAFGLVSNWTVTWPGGLATYRWLHLALGAAATLTLGALAVSRLLARRRGDRVAGKAPLSAAIVFAGLVAATGWIGGEVLVFRAGIAVEGGAHGALAPPVAAIDTSPRDLKHAMHELRASWGSASATVAKMLVAEPRDEDYDRIGQDARALSAVARWIVEQADTGGLGKPIAAGSGGEGPDAKGGGPATPPAIRPEDLLKLLSRQFASDADTLAEQAGEKDLEAIATTLGELGSMCASCHRELRWNEKSASSP